MNSNRPEDRQDFENQEVSANYEQLPGKQPPDALDRRILDRSRAAVESGAGNRLWNKWLTGLTAGATMVLAATIGLQYYSESGELYGPPSPVAEPAADGSAENAELESIQVTGSLMRREDHEETEYNAQTATDSARQSERRRSEAPSLSMSASTGPDRKGALKQMADAKMQEMQEEVAESGIQPEPEGIGDPAEIADQLFKDQRPKYRSGRNSQADSETRFQAAPAEAQTELRGAIDQSTDPLPAEDWLAEIQKLLDAGKQAEARAEMENFVQAYPNYQRPDDGE